MLPYEKMFVHPILMLWAAERWSKGSAPTIAKPRWELIDKFFNPTPLNLEMEGA